MKKFLYISITIFALLLLIDLGGAFYLLNYALSPYQRTEQNGLERLYKHRADLKPWIDSLKSAGAWHDTICEINGNRLHATYIPATVPTNKVAILVHGYKDNNIMMLNIGEMYSRQMGYNILLPDLYAHGQSEGDHIRMGWLDRLDVMQWMAIANRLFKGKEKSTQMVVHGVSMGAATTMCVAGEKQQPYVKAFVEDCGYTSVRQQFAKELGEQFSLPEIPLLPTASTLCGIRYGWTFSEASPLEQVKKCTLPILFIHGDCDDFVPTSMVYSLYEAKPGAKRLYICHGALHAQSINTRPEEYALQVKAFLASYIH